MPSLQQCQSYADQYSGYGLPRAKFYIDHDGQYAHAALFSHIYWYPDSQGMIGFPWNAVIDMSNGELAYVDGGGPGSDPTAILNTLLP
ncbi:MAG: hypothetical protein ABI333_21580 [bacterium]